MVHDGFNADLFVCVFGFCFFVFGACHVNWDCGTLFVGAALCGGLNVSGVWGHLVSDQFLFCRVVFLCVVFYALLFFF